MQSEEKIQSRHNNMKQHCKKLNLTAAMIFEKVVADNNEQIGNSSYLVELELLTASGGASPKG
jgi:hypothetical protein